MRQVSAQRISAVVCVLALVMLVAAGVRRPGSPMLERLLLVLRLMLGVVLLALLLFLFLLLLLLG